MRVLLVRPDLVGTPYALKRYGIKHQPLGLLCLAASLETAGYPVAICDEAVGDDFLGAVSSFKPDLVGFTCSTPFMPRVAALVPELQKRGIRTALGGPHVSALPEGSLLETRADVAVVGEGDFLVVDLVREGTPDGWERLEGLAVRRGEEVRLNGRAPMVTDLDELPIPARHLLDRRKYMGDGDFGFFVRPDENSIRLQSSRGCPFRCTFCAAAIVVGRKVRYRSLDLVMDEIRRHTAAWQARKIIFNDDFFTANPRRVREICRRMIDERLGLTWGCFTRVGLDEETLRLMKESGCTMVGYGIESGSPRMLELLEKRIDPEQVIRSVRLTNRIGIKTKTFFMLGLPGETREDVRLSLDLARKCRSNYLTLFTFTPLAGSPLYDRLSREEIAAYENRSYVQVGDKDLQRLQRWFLLRYHLRWHYLWHTLRHFSLAELRYFAGLARIFVSG